MRHWREQSSPRPPADDERSGPEVTALPVHRVPRGVEERLLSGGDGWRNGLFGAVAEHGGRAQRPQLPGEVADREAAAVLDLAGDRQDGEHDGQVGFDPPLVRTNMGRPGQSPTDPRQIVQGTRRGLALGCERTLEGSIRWPRLRGRDVLAQVRRAPLCGTSLGAH